MKHIRCSVSRITNPTPTSILNNILMAMHSFRSAYFSPALRENIDITQITDFCTKTKAKLMKGSSKNIPAPLLIFWEIKKPPSKEEND